MITTDSVWRNWLGGAVDSLPFAAKIYGVNSPDSIDNGPDRRTVCQAVRNL
ncbi:MAG: hypothetical protein OSJ69_17850 [Acetatifactor sp.]|nr:hypothetical protein [Acetatifactor sp.]